MTLHKPDLVNCFQSLSLGQAPVVVHASLSSLGRVEGGAQAVVEALLAVFPVVMAPTFTYKSMLIPRVGPPGNGLEYGTGADHNRMAEFFTPDMPADPLMGRVPETLRLQPHARRSAHPILSFSGVNAENFLSAQSLNEPLKPLRQIAEDDGWVLLIGVNHTVNTSIHVAERLAGRRTFIRWALTPIGVVECPGFPPCSAGFNTLFPDVERFSRQAPLGNTQVIAMPMKMLFKAVIDRIRQDPLAMLCQDEECDRCREIRKSIRKGGG